jgi:hypothetical protein
MSIPLAFISYSHDSQAHKKWVLDFAVRLRNSGIDAILDQWELQPGDDIPHFMERNLASADRVLMVCTEQYVRKANAGTGGVGYEKMIITSEMMKSIDSNKVIPIIRQAGTRDVPTFLKSKLFVNFSSDDETEFAFDELVRSLLGAPLFKKPPIGNNPFMPVTETPVERTADALLELMSIVVADFESHSREFIYYSQVVQQSRVSRILLDESIRQAVVQDLLLTDQDGDLYLTDKGKHFAVQHKLIKSA